ncbi:hypothetical protein SAMD00023353_0202200 [Rosellinia necatrix]|uniref:Uncharacterized protein n=1 Tax=Rosellinia necatrix TaxID=77044 RepID=A0A1S7UJK7_ROSNE|nr:hypothetical protein SAMD00023353_0202200 [Rosellinia necatrix]
MAGFVPLALHKEVGTRSSMGPSLTETRRRSCFSQPSPPLRHQNHHRQQSMPSLGSVMRSSLMASSALVVTPANALEWKKTIQEVKRKYLARKYRSCSMQCSEILDNLGDASAIEPLHLIYLHFYAASSFEWCARPLSSSSAYRTKLLCSAQTHYAEAETLIVATEWDMAERARSPSSFSTTSLNSPGLSASSRTTDEGSTTSSPRTSLFFLDDEPPVKPTQPLRVKPKKKVSFSGLPEFFEFQPEPYIRPDSPTLGWEDHLSVSSSHDIIASFPMSPKKLSLTSIMKPLPEENKSQVPIATNTQAESGPSFRERMRATTPVIPMSISKNAASIDQEYHLNRSDASGNSSTFNLETFLQMRALNRVRGQLSALRDQVCRHRAAVDNLLAAPIDPPHTPTQSSESHTVTSAQRPLVESPPCSPRCLQPSLQPNPEPELTPSLSASWPPPPPPPKGSTRPVLRVQTDIRDDDTAHHHHLRRYSLASASAGIRGGDDTTPITPSSIMSPPLSAGGDLRDRIERLRAAGWRRKRFDGRRYEALREQVLGELEPCC